MLAVTLGGRSVEEWKVAISPAAFQRWIAYYTAFPFDDRHRYYRPTALIARSMGGGDMNEMMDWLDPPPATGHTSADHDLFKAAGIRPPMKPTQPDGATEGQP